MPRIIYKDKNAVVIEKPVGMPSQSDPSGDLDAMTATSDELKALGEDGSLWLVHRLDRTVGGVLLFARSKPMAARLSKAVADGALEKEYLAVVEGECTSGEMRDYLFKDSGQGKAFVVKGERRGARLAVLGYRALSSVKTDGGVRTLVRIKLMTGRFHQIRAQFSSRGLPLVGDGKYGSRDKGRRVPALFARSLLVDGVNRGEPVSAMPDALEYPWSLFDLKEFEDDKK